MRDALASEYSAHADWGADLRAGLARWAAGWLVAVGVETFGFDCKNYNYNYNITTTTTCSHGHECLRPPGQWVPDRLLGARTAPVLLPSTPPGTQLLKKRKRDERHAFSGIFQ